MTKKNELELTPFGLRLALAAGASAFALSAGTAWAQDDQDDDGVELIEESDEEASSDDEIVVTGSRIKRSTFNSISPLQVITTEDSLDVGLIDPAAILQQSEAAAGTQIDSSFQGFVLDNGPGSETLNLRGLGASRTLILINGRRMAPAGSEGAPTQPSINLLPGSLIDRYDLLLDGASSVYGSDAVAGVGNAILKKDFDGLELFASGDYNQEGAGHDYTVSAAWGANNDRGFFGVGAEYTFQDRVTFADRDFLSGCDTHIEVTEDGSIRTADVRTRAITELESQGLVSAPISPCVSGAGGFANRIFDRGEDARSLGNPRFGSAYYTPGAGNLIPNFTDTGLFGVPMDQDRDGIVDVYFPDFSPGGRILDADLFNEQKLSSIMAYGEYTFEGEMNVTPFFETLVTNLKVDANSGGAVLFPDVPQDNPFNVCNPNQPNGFDCGLAEEQILLSPEYERLFQAYYFNPEAAALGFGGDDNCFGFAFEDCLPRNLVGTLAALGPQPVSAQGIVRGDRNLTEVDLTQYRLVGGVRADLPFLNVGSLANWSGEISGVFSRSDSDVVRPGIRDDRLALALGWDPTTDIDGDGVADGTSNTATDGLGSGGLLTLPGGACDIDGLSNPGLLQPDAAAGCVPVNLFTPEFLTLGVGDLSPEERAYLFDNRDFNTVYEQTVFNAFVTGSVAELPAGSLGVVLGAEYRIDSIDSQPDNVAADGLFFGFFSDEGAVGEKWTREAFAEIDIPLLGGKPLARELTFNASTRWTEDEFYGSAWTYSMKAGWRPIDPLLLKASVGTSFRAPNLRENFILGQSGFNSVTDLCAVPADAIQLGAGGTFVYNPQGDYRVTQGLDEIFANCLREGRNPTSDGFDPVAGTANQVVGVEVTTGGTEDIGPETSESFTMGMAFEQPWFDAFDLNLNVNYYDIEIDDTIIEPSNAFIVSSCYLRDDNIRSPFCDRITTGGALNTITDLDASFINQDRETVAGLDYNLTYRQDVEIGDEPVTLRANLRANQLKERAFVFVDDQLVEATTDITGQFRFPEWTASGSFSAEVAEYQFTWFTRMIGEVQQPNSDPFSDAFGSGGQQSDTCLGPRGGDTLCRDVDFADNYFEHTASVRYRGDTMTIRAGVTNVFDTTPPLVDPSELGGVRSNVPLGAGYDVDGREFFLTVTKDF